MLCDAENGDNGCLWEYPLLARLEEASVAEDGSIVFEAAEEFRERDSRDRQHVFLTGKPFHKPCKGTLFTVARLPILKIIDV